MYSLVRVARVAGIVEEALVADSNKVVGVYRLDVGRDVARPVGDCLRRARSSARPKTICVSNLLVF